MAVRLRDVTIQVTETHRAARMALSPGAGAAPWRSPTTIPTHEPLHRLRGAAGCPAGPLHRHRPRRCPDPRSAPPARPPARRCHGCPGRSDRGRRMTATCIATWLLLPLIVLIGVISWATESRSTRITRWRSQGLSWAAIATRLHCSPSTARRWASA